MIKDDGVSHKFKNDLIVTLIGEELDIWLNTFDLYENENSNDKKNGEDGSELLDEN
jgi:hypothetical protein